MKFKVIVRKKYAIRFFIRHLHFSLETQEGSIHLLESVEKIVEVVWKNKGHTSAAQLPCSKFSLVKVILVSKRGHLKSNDKC